MGFSLSYATTEASPADLAAAFGLVMAPAPPPPELGGGTWRAAIRGVGGIVLCTSDADLAERAGAGLLALSRQASVFAFSVVESANANAAWLWRDWALVWSLSYEADREPAFVADGTPPVRFGELRTHYSAAEEWNAAEGKWQPSRFGPGGCDHLFSVLDHLAEETSGYAYNGIYNTGDVSRFWTAAPRRRGLLSRLFGRGAP